MCLDQERKVSRGRFALFWILLFGRPFYTFLVVKSLIFCFGVRHWNTIAEIFEWVLWCRNQNVSWKHGLRGIDTLSLFLFPSLKERIHQSSEHLKHFEVVILCMNDWCLWDSKSEDWTYSVLITLWNKTWGKPTVRHKHFHLTFIFNQGIASTVALYSHLHLNTLFLSQVHNRVPHNSISTIETIQ